MNRLLAAKQNAALSAAFCFHRYTFLWTHGESNPDLLHAMEPFYRYTMGPSHGIVANSYVDQKVL